MITCPTAFAAAAFDATSFVPGQQKISYRTGRMQVGGARVTTVSTKACLASSQHDAKPRRRTSAATRPLSTATTAGAAAAGLLLPTLNGERVLGSASGSRINGKGSDMSLTPNVQLGDGRIARGGSTSRQVELLQQEQHQHQQHQHRHQQEHQHQHQCHHHQHNHQQARRKKCAEAIRAGLSIIPSEQQRRRRRQQKQLVPNDLDGDDGGGDGGATNTNLSGSSNRGAPGAAAFATTTPPAAARIPPPVIPQMLPGYLQSLVDRGGWKEAVDMFERIRRDEAAELAAAAAAAAEVPDSTTRRSLLSRDAYNIALLAYAKGGDGRRALELLRRMREAGGRLAPTRGSFNACLNACRYGRQRDRVFSVLEMMVEDRVTPSGKSYSSALQACAKEGNVRDARRMLGWMWTSPDLEAGIRGLRPTTWGYNCAMEACARSGDWASALELMAEMAARGLDHDAFTYGAALEACGRSGKWQEAEAVVTTMAAAYTASLEALEGTSSIAAGAVDSAMSPLAPTTVHCNALLQSYSRGKRVDKALRLLNQMLKAPARAHGGAAARVSSASPAAGDAAADIIGKFSPENCFSRPVPKVIQNDDAGAKPQALSSPSAALDAENGNDVICTPDRGRGGGGDEASAGDSQLPRWDPRLPLSMPDAISFGVVIDGCSRARRADEAVELLRKMWQEGIGGPCVVGAGGGGGGGGAGGRDGCGGGGGGGGGSRGALPLVSPNVHCVTAAITACGRAKRPEQAVSVLLEAAALQDAWLQEQARRRHRQRPRLLRRSESPSLSEPATDASPTAEAATATATAGLPAPDRRQLRQQHQRQQRQRGSGRLGEGMDDEDAPVGGDERPPATVLTGTRAKWHTGAAAYKPPRSAAESAASSGHTGEESATDAGNRSVVAVPFGSNARGLNGGISTSASVPTAAGTVFLRSLRPAYNSAINACVENGRIGEARGLIRNMRERGMRPGREAFNSLLVACADSGEALDLLAEMDSARIAPDVASFTAAIGACSRGGDLPAALELFGMLHHHPPTALVTAVPTAAAAAAAPGAGGGRVASAAGGGAGTDSGVRAGAGAGGRVRSSAVGGRRRGGGDVGRIRAPRADAQAFGAAAAACARGMDHKAAVWLLGEMREAGLRPGRPMFGAVMDACAKRGKWEKTVALLEEMTESGVAPAIRHYSSAIFACALGENPGKGMEILSAMQKKRVRANSTCVNAAMHGFALQGDWEKALEILGSMERTYHVVPDAVSYNTAMKACFRVGRDREGLALFDRMRSYPPAAARASAHGEKASARPHPSFLEVSLPGGEGARPPPAAAAAPLAPVGAGKETLTATRRGKGSSKRKSSREGGGVTGGAAEVGAFRASSPPRPDTASYNTVIAAVASAWGWEGRQQAIALVGEMRVRGLRPDSFTAVAVEKAGGKLDMISESREKAPAGR